jgi:hypothetical protein
MGNTSKKLPISITRHAIEQAQTRHGDFWRERGVDGIYHEVLHALLDGRKAKTVPRWAVIVDRRSKGKRNAGTHWYVWNAELTRCYVVVRSHSSRHGGPAYHVITVLRGATPLSTTVPVTA